MSWSFEFELGIVAYEVRCTATGRHRSATLDDDAVALDDLDLRLGRKRVAPTKIGEHPLMWREFANAGIAPLGIAPLGFAPLHPQAISLALVAAADLRAVQRPKFRAAFRADALLAVVRGRFAALVVVRLLFYLGVVCLYLYHFAALLAARRRRFANRCWRFTAQSMHRLAAM